jgi:hypothetical protein
MLEILHTAQSFLQDNLPGMPLKGISRARFSALQNSLCRADETLDRVKAFLNPRQIESLLDALKNFEFTIAPADQAGIRIQACGYTKLNGLANARQASDHARAVGDNHDNGSPASSRFAPTRTPASIVRQSELARSRFETDNYEFGDIQSGMPTYPAR